MWDRRQEFHCNSTGLITCKKESHQWSSMKSFQSFLWNVRSQARIPMQFHRTHHMGAGITSVVFNEEFSKFSLKCEIAGKNFIAIPEDSSHGRRNHISGLKSFQSFLSNVRSQARISLQFHRTHHMGAGITSVVWRVFKVFSEMWDRRQEFHCNSTGLITWAQDHISGLKSFQSFLWNVRSQARISLQFHRTHHMGAGITSVVWRVFKVFSEMWDRRQEFHCNSRGLITWAQESHQWSEEFSKFSLKCENAGKNSTAIPQDSSHGCRNHICGLKSFQSFLWNVRSQARISLQFHRTHHMGAGITSVVWRVFKVFSEMWDRRQEFHCNSRGLITWVQESHQWSEEFSKFSLKCEIAGKNFTAIPQDSSHGCRNHISCLKSFQSFLWNVRSQARISLQFHRTHHMGAGITSVVWRVFKVFSEMWDRRQEFHCNSTGLITWVQESHQWSEEFSKFSLKCEIAGKNFIAIPEDSSHGCRNHISGLKSFQSFLWNVRSQARISLQFHRTHHMGAGITSVVWRVFKVFSEMWDRRQEFHCNSRGLITWAQESHQWSEEFSKFSLKCENAGKNSTAIPQDSSHGCRNHICGLKSFQSFLWNVRSQARISLQFHRTHHMGAGITSVVWRVFKVFSEMWDRRQEFHCNSRGLITWVQESHQWSEEFSKFSLKCEIAGKNFTAIPQDSSHGCRNHISCLKSFQSFLWNVRSQARISLQFHRTHHMGAGITSVVWRVFKVFSEMWDRRQEFHCNSTGLITWVQESHQWSEEFSKFSLKCEIAGKNFIAIPEDSSHGCRNHISGLKSFQSFLSNVRSQARISLQFHRTHHMGAGITSVVWRVFKVFSEMWDRRQEFHCNSTGLITWVQESHQWSEEFSKFSLKCEIAGKNFTAIPQDSSHGCRNHISGLKSFQSFLWNVRSQARISLQFQRTHHMGAGITSVVWRVFKVFSEMWDRRQEFHCNSIGLITWVQESHQWSEEFSKYSLKCEIAGKNFIAIPEDSSHGCRNHISGLKSFQSFLWNVRSQARISLQFHRTHHMGAGITSVVWRVFKVFSEMWDRRQEFHCNSRGLITWVQESHQWSEEFSKFSLKCEIAGKNSTAIPQDTSHGCRNHISGLKSFQSFLWNVRSQARISQQFHRTHHMGAGITSVVWRVFKVFSQMWDRRQEFHCNSTGLITWVQESHQWSEEFSKFSLKCEIAGKNFTAIPEDSSHGCRNHISGLKSFQSFLSNVRSQARITLQFHRTHHMGAGITSVVWRVFKVFSQMWDRRQELHCNSTGLITWVQESHQWSEEFSKFSLKCEIAGKNFTAISQDSSHGCRNYISGLKSFQSFLWNVRLQARISLQFHRTHHMGAGITSVVWRVFKVFSQMWDRRQEFHCNSTGLITWVQESHQWSKEFSKFSLKCEIAGKNFIAIPQDSSHGCKNHISGLKSFQSFLWNVRSQARISLQFQRTHHMGAGITSVVWRVFKVFCQMWDRRQELHCNSTGLITWVQESHQWSEEFSKFSLKCEIAGKNYTAIPQDSSHGCRNHISGLKSFQSFLWNVRSQARISLQFHRTHHMGAGITSVVWRVFKVFSEMWDRRQEFHCNSTGLITWVQESHQWSEEFSKFSLKCEIAGKNFIAIPQDSSHGCRNHISGLKSFQSFLWNVRSQARISLQFQRTHHMGAGITSVVWRVFKVFSQMWDRRQELHCNSTGLITWVQESHQWSEEFSKFSLKCEIAGKNFTAIPQDSSHGCRNHISGLKSFQSFLWNVKSQARISLQFHRTHHMGAGITSVVWRVFKVFSQMWDRRQEFHCNSTGLITWAQESHQWSSMKSFQSFLWNVRLQARISLQFHRTHHMGAGITSVVWRVFKVSLKCEIAGKNFIAIPQDSSHGRRNHISGLQWRVFKVFSEMWDRRQEFHCNSTGLITWVQESHQWSEEFSKFSLKCEIAGKNFIAIPQDSSHGRRNHISGLQSKFSLKCEIAAKNFIAIPQDSSHGCRNHISGLQWRVFEVFSEMWDRRQEFHCNSIGLITWAQGSHQKLAKSHTVVGTYRPPLASPTLFNDLYVQNLDTLNDRENIFVLGDFNVDFLSECRNDICAHILECQMVVCGHYSRCPAVITNGAWSLIAEGLSFCAKISFVLER